MNIIHKLTLRHLRRNLGRTAMTVVGIMLSVAMVCAVAGFALSMREMLRESIIASRGDYHVAFFEVTPETAAQIAEQPVFETYFTRESDTEGLVSVYLRLANPDKHYMEIVNDISNSYATQGHSINTELLALEDVIAQDRVMKTILILGTIAILIIVAGSVIVIANAFYISAQERVRQFGLLKSAGATKSQIGRSILFEAFLLAVFAIPLGIALGFAIQWAVLALTNGLLTELNELNSNAIHFRVTFDPIIPLISTGIAALTLLISAWGPARRAAKTSAIDAVRQTKDIRNHSKPLKTSRLIQMLFGFEGTLAAKSLKRSRGKYRATVLSLVVSVVLFVSMSSFVWVLNKSVDMEYGQYDFEVLVSVSGGLDTLDEADRLLRSLPNADITRMQRMMFHTSVDMNTLTERALAVYEQNLMSYAEFGYLSLISVPDDVFLQHAPIPQGNIGGILVNTTGSIQENGKTVEYAPFIFEPGMAFPLLDYESNIMDMITVEAQTKEIPKNIPSILFVGQTLNLLVAETAYRDVCRLLEEAYIGGIYTAFAVTTNNPEAFCTAAREILSPLGTFTFVQDISQMTRMTRSITQIISLFGYGFIAMLSLIAVTSVIATISTGMALRRREFAMLYSAGMTSAGMKKMLNLESFLYGLKSLAIGLPIGWGLSYLIHLGMSNMAEFAYQPPWSATLISVAAVLLLTFSTMRYGKHKLNKVSIIEALRNETA